MTLTALKTGIGLRAEHYQQILNERPTLSWLEVHSENYFSASSLAYSYLQSIRQHYPISLHGVALSLGSTDPLNKDHLTKLKQLIDAIEPCFVSEHLCWNSINGQYYPELLPLPYTHETLSHIVDRIQQVQEYLQRAILIENITSYIQYSHSTIPETEFLIEVARRSGCTLLLDINNVYINAQNQHYNPLHFLTPIPADLITEIHLAGHIVDSIAGEPILIDTHSQPIAPAVWDLYQQAIQLYGCKPTLIEWDSQLPTLATLVTEAEHANSLLEQYHG